ncbi:helix-turn-helix domain-containing protein [Macrococcus lamae]|uniref:Helicase Helix-turn-helix domain-containing protein n=1 Tax=Macrococcus lamae TaxID=198484 RepID=A0A4R6BXI4_9STAP|nr:helix-turn-helix domain-containing protein [Macrococcus lamae]TDM13201.1 hypothetical protein ERX29_00955 [Macrococcus lamae]
MNSILTLAKMKKFQSKTDKSFTNILTGYKSHQTYFDALMQGLLPFYNCFPHGLKSDDESHIVIRDHQFYPYFYDSSQLTFQSLRLLTQSLSAKTLQLPSFYPVTNHLFVQQQVRQCFILYKDNPEIFRNDLVNLYQSVEKCLGTCYSYLLLPDGSGQHFSKSDILIECGITEDEIDLALLKEYNVITAMIRQHPKLSGLYIRIPLHSASEKTSTLLEQRYTVERMAAIRHVKQHTIEDHLIEMMIKDYAFDWKQFISESEVVEIRQLYRLHKFEKLKPYYENSSIDSYFKIKLALCLVIKEAYDEAGANT